MKAKSSFTSGNHKEVVLQINMKTTIHTVSVRGSRLEGSKHYCGHMRNHIVINYALSHVYTNETWEQNEMFY